MRHLHTSALLGNSLSTTTLPHSLVTVPKPAREAGQGRVQLAPNHLHLSSSSHTSARCPTLRRISQREDAMDPIERLDVSRAVVGDLPSIMAAERMDGYDRLVGRWSAEHHRSAMHDGKHVYFIARPDGAPKGRDWNSPERVSSVKRIAVIDPGRGYGRVLLSRTLHAIFEQTSTYRVWLGIFPDNDRARRAYAFQREGVARSNAFFGGTHRDELVMSILRPEWLRMHRGA